MKTIYDLIIVGGGPAGISAGIYAARQRLKTLLLTKDFGGQMARKSVNIENYPGFEEISGFELIQKFEKHLKKQEIGIERNTVRKIEKTGRIFLVLTSDKKEFQSRKRAPGRIPPDVLVSYLVSTFILVLNSWVESRTPLPPDQIDEVFRALVLPTLAATYG